MFRSTLVLSLLSFAVAACGTPSSDPVDAGPEAVVDAGPPPEEQCQNVEDKAWLTGKGDDGLTGREVAREAAGDCGLACLNIKPSDACAVKCMAEKKGVELTPPCAQCYGGIVLCTIGKCLARCIDDPQAEDCKACQDEKGCQSAFDTCTGPLDDE